MRYSTQTDSDAGRPFPLVYYTVVNLSTDYRGLGSAI